MSALFESPSKTAQQAAGISEQAAATEIGSPGAITVPQASGGSQTIAPTGSGLEGYVNQGEEAERAAIAGLGPNSQYTAGAAMSPSNYKVNPSAAVPFGPNGAAPPPPNAFAPPGATRQTMPVAQQSPPSAPAPLQAFGPPPSQIPTYTKPSVV